MPCCLIWTSPAGLKLPNLGRPKPAHCCVLSPVPLRPQGLRELRLRALLLVAAYSVISHGVPHGDLGAIELPHVGHWG